MILLPKLGIARLKNDNLYDIVAKTSDRWTKKR